MKKKTQPRPYAGRRGKQLPAFAIPLQSVPPSPQETHPQKLFAANPLLWYGLVVVAAIFLVGFSIFIIKLLDTIDEQNQRLVTAQHLAQVLQVKLAALEEDAQRTNGIVEVVSARGLETWMLDATAAHPGGFGRIFWNPVRNGGFLQASGLPAAPAGKAYRLWRRWRAYGRTLPVCFLPSSGTGIAPLNTNALAGLDASASFVLALDTEGATSPSTDIYLQSRP